MYIWQCWRWCVSLFFGAAEPGRQRRVGCERQRAPTGAANPLSSFRIFGRCPAAALD